MKTSVKTIITPVLAALAIGASAQNGLSLKGKVLNERNQPVKGAVVTTNEGANTTTADDGSFALEIKNAQTANVSVWANGFFNIEQMPLDNRRQVTFTLTPADKFRYNPAQVLPFRIERNVANSTTTADNIAKKDFLPGARKIDHALTAQVAGLQVTRTGGMPGEGSTFNLRGIRSLTGSNAPLFVINGIPYLPDTNESPVIKGLSSDIFAAYNINDIQNITVLKGAEAAMYGSLGANGVVLIETDGATSDNLNTEISYFGQFGTSWNNKRMPLLSGIAYKSYLTDIGLGYYPNMDTFFDNFPFLRGNMSANYAPYYGNDTRWQDQIYRSTFTTDQLFRVEGGDAIAKYDLSLGYALDNGILRNTGTNRYHTQLNGNVLVSKNFEINATVGLAYLTGNYMEQGMTLRTNPILAAYAKAPVLSPYIRIRNEQGELVNTPVYSNYFYGISNDMNFAVSNPTALVNTVDANNRQYDVNIKAGFTYRPLRNLTLSGIFGLYYHYNKEHMFIPGKDDKTIIPITDLYGTEENTVRDGVGETSNYFYNLNAAYKLNLGADHHLNLLAGYQAVTTKYEYDASFSRNTTNDFYQVMNNTTGTHFSGYTERWNWMNFYAHAGYDFRNYLNAAVSASLDGASSSGIYRDRMYFYPAASVTAMLANMPFMRNATAVNKLDVRLEYSITGNSRFSSTLGRSFYAAAAYQDASGIVRTQIPNTRIKPERTSQANLSVEAALLQNRIMLSASLYSARTVDVIMNMPKSSVYGTLPYYANIGKTSNKGVELSLSGDVLRLRDFTWTLGGNVAFVKSRLTSLGGATQSVTTLADGARLVSRVDSHPYAFYGLQADGVFTTQAEADAANLINSSSQRFNAGDVRYVDQNGDHRIDYKDYVNLGSPTPTYFGGLFTSFRYKGFGLSADLAYTHGNKAYNAVRRQLESVSSFGNQSIATANRWSVEGQVTDIPKATYGDPMGNNDFSSRWIEDASFLRLTNVTLSYTFTKPVFNFFRSGTIYLTGENLLTDTRYLGMDPELGYIPEGTGATGFDYAKVMQPKSVKIGINLKF